eukprot:scaffold4945_cov79-Skeletonema_marinoi.AAC.1
MFGSSFMTALPSAGKSSSSSAAATNSDTKHKTTSLPFSGFASSSFGGTSSSSKSASKALSFTSGLSTAASSDATNKAVAASGGGGFSFGGGNNTSSSSTASKSPFASTASGGSNLFAKFDAGDDDKIGSTKIGDTTSSSKNNTGGFAFGNKNVAAAATASSQPKSSSTSSTAIVPINNNNNSNYNNNAAPPTNTSLENTCLSPEGRSFHSYMYDSSIGSHVIVSEFAPFLSSSSGGGDVVSSPRNTTTNTNNTVQIKTVLPTTVSEAISIDPVIGLICVEGDNNGSSGSGDVNNKNRRLKQHSNGQVGRELVTLPWMCLYTCSSAFLLSVGYTRNEEEEEDVTNNEGRETAVTTIQGEIIQIVEPFEKELLMAPRGSTIRRIRPAPSMNSMFHRCGSMALFMREGGEEDSIGHVMLLYHGLPESLLGGGGSRGVRGSNNDMMDK